MNDVRTLSFLIFKMWAFARNTGKDVGNRDRNSNITMIPNSSLSSLPKSVISIKRSDEDKQQKLMQICKVEKKVT